MAMALAGNSQTFTAAMAKMGVIVEWDAAKAFGYLECEGKRVFPYGMSLDGGGSGPSVHGR